MHGVDLSKVPNVARHERTLRMMAARRAADNLSADSYAQYLDRIAVYYEDYSRRLAEAAVQLRELANHERGRAAPDGIDPALWEWLTGS